MEKEIRQYGTWTSPISPAMLAESIVLNDVQWDTESDTLVWAERRGKQGVLLMQAGMDAARELTDSKLSVSGGVGYGGGEFTVSHGKIYFAANGRLYRQSLSGGSAKAITPAFGNVAAPRVSADGQWLVFVHTYEGVDGLALVDTQGELWARKLAFGTDFVMQPAWHPEGTHVAYIAWNHPQMPWNGTELRLAVLENDAQGIPYAAEIQTVEGNLETAIFQPEFSPDGRYLSYVSDASGFGQLHIYDLQEQIHIPLPADEAEHGHPAWIQGMRMYGWTGHGQAIYYLQNEQGRYRLLRYDVQQGISAVINELEHYTSMNQLAVSRQEERVAMIASSPTCPPRIISYTHPGKSIPPRLAPDPDSPPSIAVIVDEKKPERILRRTTTESISPEALSVGQVITWKGHDGEAVYGIHYPPASTRFEGVDAPPLIVNVHGGPTSQRDLDYNSAAQFFATRGYAYLEVNHRGSTGFGKTYMNKHQGNWGVYDVEDSVTGAGHLAEQGLADPDRFVIIGGSAGGYTVLQSLVDKPGFYRAAICKYGISNQFMLVQDTHKFESNYSNWLLGPLPEAAEVYRARSPIFHAEKISDPVLIFQGEDDNVVPKNQSDAIVKSLQSRSVPHEYVVYADEGHGFRKPETKIDYYRKVLDFLLQYVAYV